MAIRLLFPPTCVGSKHKADLIHLLKKLGVTKANPHHFHMVLRVPGVY